MFRLSPRDCGKLEDRRPDILSYHLVRNLRLFQFARRSARNPRLRSSEIIERQHLIELSFRSCNSSVDYQHVMTLCSC